VSARRLRVLFLISQALDSGGAERFAAGLIAQLPGRRFERWLCTTRHADPATVAALADAGVRHVHLGRRAKWDVHRFAGLVGLLRRERFDVLHAHMFGSNFWGSVIGRACGVPVVIAHEQTWSYEGDRLRRLIDGQVIGRLATRVVAVSSADAERMTALEGMPAEKVVLLPNAYVPRASRGDGDLRAELGLGAATPLVGAVAVMRPQKALTVLVDAHARLLERVPGAHLAIAGDGPCRDEVELRVRRHGITRSVHLLGERQDVDAILRAVDVAAMSSDFEGLPLFGLECMANRTPLVATAVGGLPDIVDHGRTGLLVPRRDPVALADALAGLLTDPERRERLAAAAQAKLAEFTIEAVAERFAELYERLVAEAAAA
jgi:glycosyltransferase involved in cell wall biosynthesis